MTRPIVLAITGASGAAYAVRLLEVLLAAGRDVQLSISPAGAAVLQQELGIHVHLQRFDPRALLPVPVAADGNNLTAPERLLAMIRSAPTGQPTSIVRGALSYYFHQDLMAPMASGSAQTDGMVVCPCSGGTLSAIAHGASGNLIQRAADVHLKERRKLILVPRETPLSLIQLESMRRVVEAGAVLLPAAPGFYHEVTSLLSLVDFVVARICDQLGVPQQLIRRWGSDDASTTT